MTITPRVNAPLLFHRSVRLSLTAYAVWRPAARDIRDTRTVAHAGRHSGRSCLPSDFFSAANFSIIC